MKNWKWINKGSKFYVRLPLIIMETEEGDEEKEEQTQGEFFPIEILMVED